MTSNRFNLNVLRRHDDGILNIVDSTSHVVLYKHGDDGWVKLGVEGTLFVYATSPVKGRSPYGIFILNRNGTDNFSDDLEDEDDFELTPGFLMIRSRAKDASYGYWIYEEDHRESLPARLYELAKESRLKLEKDAQPTPSPQPSPAPVQGPRDITLDALFGSAIASANFQHPNSTPISTAPTSEGVQLLDALFSSVNVQPSAPSPAPATQPLSQSAGPPDSRALLDLLGIAPSGQPAPTQPQPPRAVQPVQLPYQQQQSQRHPQQQQRGLYNNPTPVATTFPPPHAAQQQQQRQPPLQSLSPRHPMPQTLPKPKPVRTNGPLVPRTVSITRGPPPPVKESARPAPASPVTPQTAASLVDEVLHSLSESSSASSDVMRSNAVIPPGLSRNDFVRALLSLVHTDANFVDTLYARYVTAS